MHVGLLLPLLRLSAAMCKARNELSFWRLYCDGLRPAAEHACARESSEAALAQLLERGAGMERLA
jgi:hypothetical protein